VAQRQLHHRSRSLINGSDFGDNILAALPDTIGQTIGNMVAGRIQRSNGQSEMTADDVINK
jgi:hypothetical protein